MKPKQLSSRELMNRLLIALEKKRPYSVISVGQTEAFVMAQYTVFSEEEFMKHGEARRANQGKKSGFNHRGIRFPNIQARNEVVKAVREADVVGYNTLVKSGRDLTKKVFQAHKINPKLIFEANLRRVIMFSQKDKFEEMLRDKKILLISSIAPEAKKALEQRAKDRLNFQVVGALPIYEYEEISAIKKQVEKIDFDLCILAAGTNATILGPYIAKVHGKVAFDIGWGMKSFITGKVVEDMWIRSRIGLANLMKM